MCQTRVDDGGGDDRTDAGPTGRLADVRDRVAAAWDAAESGGTVPDLELYLDALPDAERPAARLILGSIDRERRARLAGFSQAGPSTDPAETVSDARTIAATIAVPGSEPALPTTMAATGVFVSRSDEPAATVAMTQGGGGTVELGDTAAFTDSGGGRPHRAGPAGAPTVSGYEILGELGRGGMGVVYKARQVGLDRIVALKMVLAGAHAGEEQLSRFYAEAQAVAHLTHPHIVQIFDVGERDGLPYFSLEFVDGGSLAQTIAGKPQTPRFSAGIVRDLARAMDVAHKRGIVHRDLKPANILMTAASEPKITDFGLAKRLEGDSQQTRSGAIMGTPSYMAPEQALGLTREIGPLADQYALGAILYEMLTGRPPFQGATPLDTLELVRKQEPVPPTRLQPKIPVDLETICLRALQKESHKRYVDADAMAADLDRFLKGMPILARPVSYPELYLWRWCKRNPRKSRAMSGTIAALVLLTAIGSSAAAFTLGKQRTRPSR